MSPKTKKASSPKATAKVATKPEKPAKKLSKAELKAAAEAEAQKAASTIDPDEAEEAADEAAASGGGGGNAAAIAAASGGGEMSASFKNFRHHPDMENFYRFIYENDLRHEALAIIDEVLTEKHARRAQGKGAAHKLAQQ